MSRVQPLYTAMIMVTTQCHNFCSFCFNRNDIPMTRQELSIDEWIAVLNDLKQNTTMKNVFFVGRECFDKANFERLIEVAGKLGFQVYLYTGGSDNLTLEAAQNCALWLRHMIVSFHGLESIISHQTYSRQVRLLELVRDVFLPSEVHITVTTTVTKKHAGKIKALTDQIAQLIGRKAEIYEEDDHLMIRYCSERKSKEEWEPSVIHNFAQPCLQGGMLQHLEELAWTMEKDSELFTDVERRLIGNHRCSRQIERILEHSLSPNGRPCGTSIDDVIGAAGLNRMTIRWDGEVVPCNSSYRYSFGNILKKGAVSLWETAYSSMRIPEIVNAYTLWAAYSNKGACCYGQDAAYIEGQSEENIIECCASHIDDWYAALKKANLKAIKDEC